jgi:hypothetical protein
MRTTVRRVAALPLLASVWLLTACTGGSLGQADPNAPSRAGEKAQQFAVSNGRLIAAALVAIGVTWLLKWLTKSWPVRIIAALF